MEVLHHCKERRSKNMRAASPLLSFFSVTVLFTTDDYGTGTKYEDELHNTIYSNGTGSKYNKNINTASFVFILPGL